MTTAKPRKVSLSGRTRLTYREAFALLEAANSGQCEYEFGDEEPNKSAKLRAMEQAIDKLKTALTAAGGYDSDGNLFDPFQ